MHHPHSRMIIPDSRLPIHLWVTGSRFIQKRSSMSKTSGQLAYRQKLTSITPICTPSICCDPMKSRAGKRHGDLKIILRTLWHITAEHILEIKICK